MAGLCLNYHFYTALYVPDYRTEIFLPLNGRSFYWKNKIKLASCSLSRSIFIIWFDDYIYGCNILLNTMYVFDKIFKNIINLLNTICDIILNIDGTPKFALLTIRTNDSCRPTHTSLGYERHEIYTKTSTPACEGALPFPRYGLRCNGSAESLFTRKLKYNLHVKFIRVQTV